jgi:hypothetical protein
MIMPGNNDVIQVMQKSFGKYNNLRVINLKMVKQIALGLCILQIKILNPSEFRYCSIKEIRLNKIKVVSAFHRND